MGASQGRKGGARVPRVGTRGVAVIGGKTSTSSSTVAVPPQVLAQYQSVNARANQTADKPFQTYSGEFVAPVNAEQTAGIVGTNAAANEAQPYYGAATGVLGAAQGATTPVNTAAEVGTAESSAPLTGAQIDQYLSPYLGTVLNSTEEIQNQENQRQQAGQLGDAIRSGAFGSDRTGIAAANLEQQQNLANANIISNIANTGYQSALSTAQGQQQIGLAGAQQEANIGQMAYGEGANTSSQLAGLGAGAQSAALTGAQAEIGAGTVQQQTQQAQDTAQYNQFLQQQSYPFQVDQFLADIAEGTGSLSGSTTTTTQPGGFFSDKELKRDIQKIGETFDGQPIYSYKMGNDERTRIGLIAQDVEKKHPHAVGVAGGFKMVDYGKATREAANKGHFYTGGVVPFRRVHRDTGGGLAGVLQAQEQMYSDIPGQQRRQISYGGGGAGGRDLAVANAPASPPPSGASELGQTMSLADKGYHLYKDFSAPSTAPAATSSLPAGVSPAVGAGPTTAELSTTAPAADALSEVAPAAASTAAPAATAAAPAAASAAPAAAGAASAAAPAAAGAAGTAAGTAAIGAGTTAAAESAAALAAEYAAADAAVAAAAAAKRGGRIKRQGGGSLPYGESGLPYGDSNGLDIPSEQNTNTLKAAPAAGKQPTGFQTSLYMGNPENTSTLMGDMFSNTAFARGGVAGRPGFDDGGGAGGDTEKDDSDADQPSGVAASNAPASSAPVPSGGGIAGWWGRNKGTILPILAGIGAAGTAPTVHPGVALAAGLEEAARDYVSTQEGLAVAQREQALARGQELQNVITGVKAGVAQSAFAPQAATGVAPQTQQATPPAQRPASPANPAPAIIAGAGAPGAPTPPSSPPAGSGATGASAPVPAASSPSDAAQTAAGLAAQYRKQFFVNTARTPEEQAEKDAAIKKDWAVGGQLFEQQADNDFQARVQRDQQNARNTAQQLADAQYALATDPARTAEARAAALARYNALRQWTGDGTEIQGGIVKNTRTNQPEIGTIAQQGLSPQERSAAFADAMQPITVGNQLPQPTYKAYGFSSPDAYVAARAAAARVGAPMAPNGAPSAPPSGAPPQAAAPPARASGSTPSAGAGMPSAPAAATSASPQGAAPTAGNSSVVPGAPAADPYLNRALADPQYRLPPLPPVTDQTSQKAAFQQQQLNIDNKNQLLAGASTLANASATALQYLQAAQAALSGKPLTGTYGNLWNAAVRAVHPGSGTLSSNDYLEASKWLVNAAAQQAQATFPGATEKEMGIALDFANPSVHMEAPALNDMISANERIARYGLLLANKATVAANQGINPQAFPEWAQKYWPRDKLVNATEIRENASGQRIYLINGKWVQ